MDEVVRRVVFFFFIIITGLQTRLSLTFCKFLAGAATFDVDAVHPGCGTNWCFDWSSGCVGNQCCMVLVVHHLGLWLSIRKLVTNCANPWQCSDHG